jgi:hypothetical protein
VAQGEGIQKEPEALEVLKRKKSEFGEAKR